MQNPTTTRIKETSRHRSIPIIMIAPDLSKVYELSAENAAEVQNFLAVRPVHTVIMSSFIADNGIVSDLNRGKFYGYRNAAGKLEGVALIGHSTLVEARSEAALKALAFTARRSETPIHVIMSSGESADQFWNYMTGGLSEPRLRCTEELFELSFPFAVQRSEWKIENATMDRLIEVAEAQAEVAFIECGVDPMLRDREGFLKRVARRIQEKRIFVVLDGDKMVFKADIIAETDNCIYLEGIYVSPSYRGRGVGSKCLSSLSLGLLDRVENICLLSNIDFEGAHRSFQKAGFKRSDQYTTLFV